MNNQELQTLVEKISRDYFNKPFGIKQLLIPDLEQRVVVTYYNRIILK